MAKILITGCFGFIGSKLFDKLLNDGHDVYGVGRSPSCSEGKQSQISKRKKNIEIKLAELENLSLDNSASYDYLFHFAGGASVAKAEENNYSSFNNTVSSTLELLEWSRVRHPNATIIIASSAAVYGANEDNSLLVEESILSPISNYGRHKIIVENLALAYNQRFKMDVRIARLFSVYGPGLKKQFLWDFCNRLSNSNGKCDIEVFGTGNEIRDWINIDDITSIVSAFAFGHSSERIINVGTGKGTTVKDIAQTILDTMAIDARLNFNGQVRKGDPESLVANIHKMNRLGLSVDVDVNRGIQEYVRWYLDSQR